MARKEELIDSLTDRCEMELNYYDLVNERNEEIDFRPIVEFIVDTILDVWKDGKNAN